MENKAPVYFGAFLLLSSLLFATRGHCGGATYTSTEQSFSLRLNTGYLSGESGEYLYDAYGAASGIPGYKISQLNWKIDAAYMAGIGATYRLSPTLHLNADYWHNVGKGDATMDDYDWLYVGLDWSHWSHHDNTSVTNISSIDLNLDLTLLQFDDEQSSIVALFGYKKDHFAWQASGGYGIYSNYAYRDYQVTFPDVPGISYEQTYRMPYVGMGFRSATESDDLPVVLKASARFSNWVQAKDADIHYLRVPPLYFEESGSGGKWFAYDIGLDFGVAERTSLTLGYSWQNYKEIKAAIAVTDLTSKSTSYYPDPSAGLDHSSSMFTATLHYLF